VEKGDFGDYLWVERQEPVREGRALMDWMWNRSVFFYFFLRARLKKI
jgi:hypothetical protein